MLNTQINQYTKQNSSCQTTIRRILKVNHAGEWGAICIYRAQLWFARHWYPHLVMFLEETLDHEIKHRRLFANAMMSRQTRSCRIAKLWSYGGYVLGFVTALLGEQGIWICTFAVEETVHSHMEDQLAFLAGRDEELHSLINIIKEEELHHLDHARAHITHRGLFSRGLHSFITFSTNALIFLSTWGDSARMPNELKLRRCEQINRG